MHNKSIIKEDTLKRIKAFRLFDDDFMNACFDDNIEGTELLLRIILNKPDLHVPRVTTQRFMKNLLGRDLRLDVDAIDDKGQIFDIEIQRSNAGADPKRARYHSSILDAHLLKPGQDFKDLPETYVIFIAENDAIGEGKPIYIINRTIEGVNRAFNDGEHILYVNGEITDPETALGRLMHDFSCTDPDNMYYEELARKAKYFKEHKEGVRYMSGVMEAYKEEITREVTREVTRENALMTAMRMLQNSELTLEQIALYSNLPLEDVIALKGSL